ncbi:unnamed protein product [Victoria cruziana]
MLGFADEARVSFPLSNRAPSFLFPQEVFFSEKVELAGEGGVGGNMILQPSNINVRYMRAKWKKNAGVHPEFVMTARGVTKVSFSLACLTLKSRLGGNGSTCFGAIQRDV